MAVAVEPIAFASSVVTRDDARITLALFDGADAPACVAILQCGEETAKALRRNLRSALNLS